MRLSPSTNPIEPLCPAALPPSLGPLPNTHAIISKKEQEKKVTYIHVRMNSEKIMMFWKKIKINIDIMYNIYDIFINILNKHNLSNQK
jgi:hypothetical protein